MRFLSEIDIRGGILTSYLTDKNVPEQKKYLNKHPDSNNLFLWAGEGWGRRQGRKHIHPGTGFRCNRSQFY